MPELPEVETTVRGLKKTVIGLKIKGVWTSYRSNYAPYKNQIKNPKYFSKFKKEVVGQKIISAERRHKNILVHLSNNKTILIHMKMTGHLMYGQYKKTGLGKGKTDWHKEEWEPIDKNKNLHDLFNRHIRFVITFSNNKQLVLSDMRKFAKITLLSDKSDELNEIGPEPLEKSFNFKTLKERLYLRPKSPIKTVLMDPKIVAGIGNIYSDEILWKSCVNPKSVVESIPESSLKSIFNNIKPMLKKGIELKGDSTSDYRNIDGSKGKFQGQHNAYRKTGTLCEKKGCNGKIEKLVIGGRSAHFCNKHQKEFK